MFLLDGRPEWPWYLGPSVLLSRSRSKFFSTTALVWEGEIGLILSLRAVSLHVSTYEQGFRNSWCTNRTCYKQSIRSVENHSVANKINDLVIVCSSGASQSGLVSQTTSAQPREVSCFIAGIIIPCDL